MDAPVTNRIWNKQLHWIYFFGLLLAIAGLAGSHWIVNPYRLAIWLYSSDTGSVVIESRCAGQDTVALRHRQVVTAGFFEYQLPLPKCWVTSIELSSDGVRELRQEVATATITYYGTVIERMFGTPRTLEGEGIFALDTRPNRSRVATLASPFVLIPTALDASAVRLWWPRWLPFLLLPLAWWLARRLAAPKPRYRESMAVGNLYSFLMVAVLTLIVTMGVIARTDVSVHPDELAHVANAHYYFDHWAKPRIGAPETLDLHRTNRYGVGYITGTDPVYLLAAKFAVELWPAFQNDVVALRMFNATLFGMLACLSLGTISVRLVMIPLLATPQAWYVFSYFNGDALPLSLSMLAMVAFLGIQKSEAHERASLPMAVATALAGCLSGLILLSKPNYWPILGAVALLLIARARYLTGMQLGLLSFGWMLSLLGVFLFLNHASEIPFEIRILPLAAGLGCLLWQGTFLVRNIVRQHRTDRWWFRMVGLALITATAVVGLKMADEVRENPLPFSSQRADALLMVTEATAAAPYRPSALANNQVAKNSRLRDQGITLGQMFSRERWFASSFNSFLGVYGYLNIGPANHFALALGGAFLAVAIVIFMLAGRYAGRGTGATVQLSMAVGVTTVLAASIGFSWIVDVQPQGRYLLGILPILGGGLVVAGRDAARSRILELIVVAAFALSATSFLLVGIQGIPKLPGQY